MKRSVTQCNARLDAEEKIDDGGHARPLKVAEIERQTAVAKQVAIISDANKRWFIRECEAAGIPTDSPVSPSLLKALKRTTGTPP